MSDTTPQDRPSSAAAEQIEDLVLKKLAAYPDLANAQFDFGTVADGTLDIWFDGHQYDDVKDITDVRVRKAIEEAVKEFNA